jgi:hypothetical protein
VWLRPRPDPQLAEIVEVLHGLGTMLMSIDAKLEDVANLLGEDDNEP